MRVIKSRYKIFNNGSAQILIFKGPSENKNPEEKKKGMTKKYKIWTPE